MVEDLIVSCCTEVNNSVADECHMNPDVKKWSSMSKGSDNFAREFVCETTREGRDEGNACKEAIVFAIPPTN